LFADDNAIIPIYHLQHEALGVFASVSGWDFNLLDIHLPAAT